MASVIADHGGAVRAPVADVDGLDRGGTLDDVVVGEYLTGWSKNHPRAGRLSTLVSEGGHDVDQAGINLGGYLAVRQRALLTRRLLALQTPEAGQADHDDVQEDQELAAHPAGWPAAAPPTGAVRAVPPARPPRASGHGPAGGRRPCRRPPSPGPHPRGGTDR